MTVPICAPRTRRPYVAERVILDGRVLADEDAVNRVAPLGGDVDDVAGVVGRVIARRGDDGIDVGRCGPAVDVIIAQAVKHTHRLLIDTRHVTPQIKPLAHPHAHPLPQSVDAIEDR